MSLTSPGCFIASTHHETSEMSQAFGDGKFLYWNRFVDRVAAATRGALAILIVALILDCVPKEVLDTYFAYFTTFAPLIAANAGEATLGKIIENVFAITEISVLTTCATIIIFRFLEPPLSLGLTVACIGISAFSIAYPTHITLLGKKVGLSQIVITFISAHLKGKVDKVYLPLKSLASILVGTAAALVAYSIPAPRLGAIQVKRSANSAVRCLNELFKTVTSGFSTNDPSALYSVCVHTQALRKSATDAIEQLHSIKADLWWELRGCCSLPVLNNLIDGLSKLNLYICGMEYSLKSNFLLKSPPTLRETMTESLDLLGEESKNLLITATDVPLFPCFATQGSLEIEESREALVIFDETFLYARRMTYYSPDILKKPEKLTSKESASCILEGLRMRGQSAVKHISTDTHDISPSSREKFMARATTYFFLFNARLYMEQAMQLIDPYLKPLREQKTPGLKKWIPGLEQRMGFSGDSPQPGNVIQKDADSLSPNPSLSRTRSKEVICEECASIQAKKEVESGFAYRCSQSLKSLLLPQKKQIKFAIKISITLMLATLFGSLDLEGDSHQAWAASTVCYIIGYHRGGTFRLALERFQGTSIGAVFGYLAIRGSGDKGYIIIIVITVWTLLTNIIKHSKVYGYSGGCAGTTAVGMMLGDPAKESQKYAVEKITQTFIGVMSYMLVEVVVFPDQAKDLVKRQLIENLGGLKKAIMESVDMYNTKASVGCLECHQRRVDEIKSLEQELRKKLELQIHLHEEAASEPDLWWVPFPRDAYSRIVSVQGQMLDLLLFMVCCLQASAEDEYDEHMQTLLEPLQVSLTNLKDDVTATLDLLQELLNDPNKKHPNLLEKDFCCCKVSITFQTSDDLESSIRGTEQNGQVHPLRVLDNRRRTVGGTPLDSKSVIDNFEHVYETVFEDIIAESKKEGGRIVNNSIMLSISSLSFCLHALLKETVELEKAVYNLLQVEQPWNLLDFWDAYVPNRLWQRGNSQSLAPDSTKHQ
ncbi:hypothetical protein R1sor_026719 [Riccia sorocarpa]|uniref:Integral membrane bound transporter domain-containing protein n=1 Tax=Riccia sorocarpa TaxID=122646 RepID=A0ABD3GDW9_9MARC